ncbi:MAG TPA: hypothetical protein VI864_02580 [Candidatus Bathyarchaeia archaeon]|nr:hypothetical protein [Candidatus Bathyarchaeia archaeon]
MKGKPWAPEDEKKLKDLFKSGIVDFGVLASSLKGKYSEEGVRQKLMKLGLLKEQQQRKNVSCCSSKLVLPEELPSVEEALKTLSAALKLLEKPGLSKAEIQRLRSIISGVKIYKELFADYVNYRGLEAELFELREKYAELVKKTKGAAAK